MKPKRYPYSGKRKKPIEVSIDLLTRISALEEKAANLSSH